jgi:hypothetical protein
MRIPFALFAALVVCVSWQARAEPAFENLTPEQGRALLALARDFDAQEDHEAAAYDRCVARYDAQARDPGGRQPIEEALKMVKGAARRMGHERYADISDQDERLRLAKMLSERGWLKSFRAEISACLGASPAR